MAFDVNNPTDLLALKTEVNTDPISMGYDPNITSSVLTLINDVASNVGGETINKNVEDVTLSEIAEAINKAEYAALDEWNKEWVKMFIDKAEGELIANYKPKLLSIFGAGTTTRGNLTALLPKLATRAEVLFGVNSVISKTDWITARDSA